MHQSNLQMSFCEFVVGDSIFHCYICRGSIGSNYVVRM